jgi:integrase
VLRLDTKKGRDALDPRPAPYFTKLSKGRSLGFRKLADGSGTWVARLRTDAGKQEYEPLGELSEAFGYDQARSAAETWFRDFDRGIGAARGDTPVTVAFACREYVDERRRNKSVATAHDANRRFEREVYGGRGKQGRYDAHIIAAILLTKLRRKQVEAWRDGLLAGGMSKATANRTLNTLKAALNCAVTHRLVAPIVAIEWEVPPYKDADGRRDIYLDVEQRRAFLAAAAGTPVRNLIHAAILTGARAGELTSARRSQFDARTKSITFTGKTGTRTIPLAPAAVTLFKQLAEGKLPGAYLLPSEDGKPWGRSKWTQPVHDVAVKAGLPKGTVLYTCRHSWITAAITEGMSPLEVARLVGTSLKMIDKNYGHLVDGSARERLATMAML